MNSHKKVALPYLVNQDDPPPSLLQPLLERLQTHQQHLEMLFSYPFTWETIQSYFFRKLAQYVDLTIKIATNSCENWVSVQPFYEPILMPNTLKWTPDFRIEPSVYPEGFSATTTRSFYVPISTTHAVVVVSKFCAHGPQKSLLFSLLIPDETSPPHPLHPNLQRFLETQVQNMQTIRTNPLERYPRTLQYSYPLLNWLMCCCSRTQTIAAISPRSQLELLGVSIHGKPVILELFFRQANSSLREDLGESSYQTALNVTHRLQQSTQISTDHLIAIKALDHADVMAALHYNNQIIAIFFMDILTIPSSIGTPNLKAMYYRLSLIDDDFQGKSLAPVTSRRVVNKTIRHLRLGFFGALRTLNYRAADAANNYAEKRFPDEATYLAELLRKLILCLQNLYSKTKDQYPEIIQLLAQCIPELEIDPQRVYSADQTKQLLREGLAHIQSRLPEVAFETEPAREKVSTFTTTLLEILNKPDSPPGFFPVRPGMVEYSKHQLLSHLLQRFDAEIIHHPDLFYPDEIIQCFNSLFTSITHRTPTAYELFSLSINSAYEPGTTAAAPKPTHSRGIAGHMSVLHYDNLTNLNQAFYETETAAMVFVQYSGKALCCSNFLDSCRSSSRGYKEIQDD